MLVPYRSPSVSELLHCSRALKSIPRYQTRQQSLHALIFPQMIILPYIFPCPLMFPSVIVNREVCTSAVASEPAHG